MTSNDENDIPLGSLRLASAYMDEPETLRVSEFSLLPTPFSTRLVNELIERWRTVASAGGHHINET